MNEKIYKQGDMYYTVNYMGHTFQYDAIQQIQEQMTDEEAMTFTNHYLNDLMQRVKKEELK